jgi:hypothetical protein
MCALLTADRCSEPAPQDRCLTTALIVYYYYYTHSDTKIRNKNALVLNTRSILNMDKFNFLRNRKKEQSEDSQCLLE